jgi:hypothetical protein
MNNIRARLHMRSSLFWDVYARFMASYQRFGTRIGPILKRMHDPHFRTASHHFTQLFGNQYSEQQFTKFPQEFNGTTAPL